MYLRHFGLSAFPFSATPDPRFFFPSAKHKEALACLLYAVEQRKGFALLTGEVGAGKSMLCRTALERLGPTVDCAMIVHSSLSPRQFFQAVCAEFNLNTSRASKIELIHTIKAHLIARHEQGRITLLLVDEAQDLPGNVLEEIRLLGNLETPACKLLQIILVGQPELRQMIATPDLRQLNQRIAVKFHLGALSEADSDAYIVHRLTVAGATDPNLFDQEARLEVFRATGGVPRMMNILCDQALLQTFVSGGQSVQADTVSRVLAEAEGYYMDAPAPLSAPAAREF